MATRGANTSLAAELLSLIDEEEYIQTVPLLKYDDYLNKNEVASLKKMTSGKLWVDNRKFVTRQNTPIDSGLFELFGGSMSKSANDIKTEAYDFLLDPDNKNIRSILRESLKAGEIPYSKWIEKLSNEYPSCDAATLYLLCRTFKRHAVVVTSSKIWSSFKPGNRTPLDMFVKADYVLLWLGCSMFAEIKPLKTVTATLGPLVEWQQLTDSVHVLHEKRLTEKKARKPRQPKPPPKSPSVSTPRKGTKRQSKVQIDYKSMHNEGLSARSPKQRKLLPKASGPSESRLESQRMITRELLQKQTHAKGYNVQSKIIGTCIKTESKEDVKIKLENKTTHLNIKSESTTSKHLRHVKVKAAEIYMTHRKNPNDEQKKWNYVHPSGSPCGRKHLLRGNLRSDELPDLIPHRVREDHMKRYQTNVHLLLALHEQAGATQAAKTSTPRHPKVSHQLLALHEQTGAAYVTDNLQNNE